MASKSIWSKPYGAADLNQLCQSTIHDALGIKIDEVGHDWIAGRMPVDERTRQPFGILHGGASGVLAESLGSLASMMVVGAGDEAPVGIELTLRHVRSISAGWVIGKATSRHLGRTLHIWEVEICDESSTPICFATLTVLIRSKPLQTAPREPQA